jgi:hypothetical protein
MPKDVKPERNGPGELHPAMTRRHFVQTVAGLAAASTLPTLAAGRGGRKRTAKPPGFLANSVAL